MLKEHHGKKITSNQVPGKTFANKGHYFASEFLKLANNTQLVAQ